MAAMLDGIFSPVALSGAGGPRYLQLKRMIEQAVHSAAIRPGEALPAEREIAALTGLSRVTVRKAVQDLVREGLLVQRHGSGTFVAPRVGRVEQSLSNLTSFTEDMARAASPCGRCWLDRGIYDPSPEEFIALGLSSNERVSRIARLRIGDDSRWRSSAPRCRERAARPLPRRDLALRGARDGPACVRSGRSSTFPPSTARATGCRPSRRPGGSAGLNIERISYLATGKVVEFTRSIYRGDAYDFVAELRLSGAEAREDRS